jgi:hypothetical protein
MPSPLIPKKEIPMETAKRQAPAAKPVVHKGIRYMQLRRPQEQGFTQSGGVIAAIDEATEKQLWVVQLYQTAFNVQEERDAQEVYLSELRIDAKNGMLIAIDERKRHWQISLTDRSVRQLLEIPALK